MIVGVLVSCEGIIGRCCGAVHVGIVVQVCAVLVASVVHRQPSLLMRDFGWRRTGGSKVARLDVDGRGMVRATWRKRVRVLLSAVVYQTYSTPPSHSFNYWLKGLTSFRP